jgi:diguanylate cyclase (GGDEF)-like protein/PAS domain S-box-containing protein
MEACLSSDFQSRWLPLVLVFATILLVGIATWFFGQPENRAGGLLLALASGLLAWFVVRMPARHRAMMKQANAAAQRSEARLSKLKREIEMRIEMRSRALIQTNQELLQEVAERRQAIQKLHEQHTFSLALLRAQSDVDEGVLVIQDNHIVFANEAMVRLSGYSLAELLNNFPFINLVHPDQREVVLDKHRRRLAGEQIENHYEAALISRDGGRHEVELAEAVVHDGKKIQIVVVVHDITERKQLLDNLQHMAHFDELTSLPNRALFFDRLRRSLADARRHGSGFALLFVDLDGFKAVNDAYGHHFGDQLLNEVARRMEQCVRESDTVARMGGDEFAIILGDVNDADDARLVAQKIINSLSTSLSLDGKECHVGASIGISLYPQDGENSESMLTNADSAMYSAKSKGKNTYSFVRG